MTSILEDPDIEHKVPCWLCEGTGMQKTTSDWGWLRSIPCVACEGGVRLINEEK